MSVTIVDSSNTSIVVVQPSSDSLIISDNTRLGVQGIQGAQGTQGTQGTQGVQGTQGTQGIQGTQGVEGLQGPSGDLIVAENSGPPINVNLINFLDSETITVDIVQNGTNANISFTAVGGAAFDQANAAYIQANAAFDAANTANINALIAYSQANAAYTAANNAKVTVYANSSSNVTTQVINFINTASVLVDVTADGSNANVSFLAVGGPAYDQANAAYAQANAAFEAANNNQVTVAANNGLAISNTDVLSTIYNTTISDGVTSVAVGGASALDASEWRNKNIVQVLDTILFPDIAPTYTIPTITISASVTGTREIGETINQTLTSQGTKNDANTFTQIAFRRGSTTINTNTSLSAVAVANVADQFGYTNPNNPNFRYTGTYTDSFVVVSGTTSWLARGSYGAGVAKKNNKGVDDPRTPAIRSVNAPQAACTTFDSATTTISGIYPYFWGVSATQPTASSIAADIAAGNANKVLASSTGTITVTFNASSQYVWLAHIGTSTSKTKWYNTALNNGDIGAGQFILAPVNQNVNSPNGFWSAQSFKIYISGFATTTSGSIEFRNT